MSPFIEALQRIRDLTAEWPGDDMAAARVIGTVNAIAYGALLANTEGTKPKQETTTVKNQFDLDMTIDLHDGCGVFAHDVECTVTIDYEVERYLHGDYVVTAATLTDIRFPNVPTATTAKDWLWPMFKRAVSDKAEYIDAAIRNHVEDATDFTPAANLHLMSAVS